jgi:CIC family chloride channel protein
MVQISISTESPSGSPTWARRLLDSRLVAALRRSFRGAGEFVRWLFDLEGSGETVLLSAVIGAAAGLVAFLFISGLQLLIRYSLNGVIGYTPPAAGEMAGRSAPDLDIVPWAVLVIPALGGLVSGWLVYTFCPEAEGHGSDAMVRSYHRLQGAIRGRVPLVKGLASIITIGTGGSAGREGPIAQVGAGVGSAFAKLFGLGPDQRRQLMLAGAAGGIAAVFQAPLGAALFVCEVLYASTAVETGALLYCVISAVTGYAVFIAFHGQGHEIIAAKSLAFHGLADLPLYAVFALVCSIAGQIYVWVFYGLRDRFRDLPLPNFLKPAIGGLLLGAMILVVRGGSLTTGIPHVMAGGYGWIQQALDGELTSWKLLALLAVVKIVGTSLTISSGGSGGVFAPSLFIGAMLGGAYGWLGHELFPSTVTQPQVFVLVGMGAFFASVAKVPLTAVVMVSEMTGSFALLVPLMFVCVLGHALTPRRRSLYEEQVHAPVDSPAHQGDFLIDVLADLKVSQVYDPKRPVLTIDHRMPLRHLVRLVSSVESSYFPVVNGEGRMVGIFSLSDIRSVLPGITSENLIFAADIATSPVLTVSPEDDLHTALQRFTLKNIDELPVVDSADPDRLLGMLRRKELIAAYHHEVERLRAQGDGAELSSEEATPRDEPR